MSGFHHFGHPGDDDTFGVKHSSTGNVLAAGIEVALGTAICLLSQVRNSAVNPLFATEV